MTLPSLLARLFPIGLLVAVLAPACSSNASDGAALCNPGDELFCRCRGGREGTKRCNADGSGFGDCVGDSGTCTPVDEPTSDPGAPPPTPGQGGGGGDVAPPSVGGGGADAATGADIFAACSTNDACASGICAFGYCTKDCTTWQDCDPTGTKGDCVSFMGETGCMPYCTSTQQCVTTYGDPSVCGFALAVPDADNPGGFPAAFCNDWQNDLAIPPAGSACEGDADCNLGNPVSCSCSAGACSGTGCG